MPPIIVSDASCLILYSKIVDFLILKKVFKQITITESVSKEFNQPLPCWVQVRNPVGDFHLRLLNQLDYGEATSISLASEFENSLLIIDELKGRKIAKELNINITGSLGILVAAKNKGIIDSVKPILLKVRQTNFRLSDKLIEMVLLRSGEG